MQEREGGDGNEPLVIADPGEDWRRCENCIQMRNTWERICCQASSEIIAEKVESHKCISLTDGFRDVCLNKERFGSSTWLLASNDRRTSRKKQ